MSLLRLTFSYLDKLAVFSFIGEIRLIINKLKALPPVLVSPNPPIATMEGQLTLTEAAAEAAKSGDRDAIRTRNDEIAVMKAMVVQQGGTVVGQNLTANQAQELGFRVAKDPTPAPPIDAPQGVKAKPTLVNNGVEVSWRRTKYAYGFEVQKTTQNPLEGEVTWEDVLFTNRSKVTIENAGPEGSILWFRVVGFSSHGQSPYSNPVKCVVA